MPTPTPDSGGVPVFNPEGKLVTIPALDQSALLWGYRQATPGDVTAALAEEKYGGAGQAIGAAGEGALNALTFGTGTAALRGLGVTTKEGELGRKEAHPVAHGVGTALGIVAPIVATFGAAAPVEGAALAGQGALAAARGAAEYAAPNLIARAGQAVAGAANGALPGLAGRVLPAVAGGAAEGALYSGADLVERKLLGDPDLTAEKMASELGVGALFGGALSGGGKLMSELLPKNLGESMADWLGKTAGNRNLKAAGAIQGDLGRALKTKSPEALNEIGQEFGERGLVGPLTTPKDTLERAQSLIAAGQKEAGALTAAADAAAGATRFTWDGIRSELEPDLMAKLKSRASSLKAADQLASELDGLSAVYGDKTLGFSDLHSLRIDVDKLAGYGVKNMDPAVRPVAGPLKQIRRHLDKLIEDGIESTTGAGDAWREAMRKQEVGLLATQFANKAILRATGNNLVSPTEFLAGLAGVATHGPAGALAAAGTHLTRTHASGVLGWAATGAQRRILQIIARSDKRLASQVGAIFGEGASAAAGAAATGTERFAHGGVVAPEKFAEHASSLRDLGGNLDRLAETVSRETSALGDHAPAAAASAHALAARVVSHLGSRLPQDTGPRKLLDAPYQPTQPELSAYNRHHEVAQRGPAAVLEHLKAGTLHPDHLAASQAIYPKLHAEAQQMVAERLAAHLAKKERIPIALRPSLGLFLGSDLEHATTPQAVLSAQLTYAQPAPQQQPPGKPSRQVETNFGQRSATSSQGNETRMRKV